LVDSFAVWLPVLRRFGPGKGFHRKKISGHLSSIS
jgi:hypothetical protein